MPISPPCMSQLELGGPPPSARSRTGPAIDGDESDSRLDEPSGQEQVLSQRMHAVAVAHGGGLPFQLERLRGPPVRSPARRPGRADPAILSRLDFRTLALSAGFRPSSNRRRSCIRSGGTAGSSSSGALKAGHGRVIGRPSRRTAGCSSCPDGRPVPIFGAQKTGSPTHLISQT